MITFTYNGKSPRVAASALVADTVTIIGGRVKVPGFPVTFSGTPAAIRRQAPEFGEHTEEILIEVLGMDWDDIVKLREQEIIL
jgi:crotonobetainyl-CoA:carnitine CoA-transferase CaiB-like acyl-CoA transferase